MRLAILGGLAVLAALLVGNEAWGFRAIYRSAYGAIVLMAAMIAATFLWLWLKRATPLALGMVASWSGGACVMGWWWCFSLLGRPPAMAEHPALFAGVALYLIGAAMHFSVIGGSLGWPRLAWFVPVGLAIVVSVALAAAI